MAQAIQHHLADLPQLVTPEILASKLGVKVETIYQRLWRQKKDPSLSILPPVLPIPGCNKVAFARQSCIDWWCDFAQSEIKTSENVFVKKRVGRPDNYPKIKRKPLVQEIMMSHEHVCSTAVRHLHDTDLKPFDFYAVEIAGFSFKNDNASMEAPIFALSKNPDKFIWEWASADGKKTLSVIPSALYGRATIYDKDVLIYALSCVVGRLNYNMPVSKTVRFSASGYFKATLKTPCGKNYDRLESALNRLATTSILTNIKTGGIEIKSIFHLVESASFYKKDGVTHGVEITLSDWLFSAANSREILTINNKYFELKKPLEKRLYEIARKHCGNQAKWKIGLANLKKKCGSLSSLNEFQRMVKEVINADKIPDYRLCLDGESVIFYTADVNRLASRFAS